MKAGRYTAALLLIATGIGLLADMALGTDYLLELVRWWPLLLILLGVEYLWFSAASARQGGRKLTISTGGILFSVLVSGIVIGVMHYSSLPFNVWDRISWSFGSQESGIRYDKPAVVVRPGDGDKVLVDNPNGNVTIRSGPVSEIQIEATVWVDRIGESEAARVAERTYVKVTEGAVLTLEAQLDEYRYRGMNRKARLNMEITVPEQQELAWELRLKNGMADVEHIPLKDVLKVSSVNGQITLARLQAQRAEVTTTNGLIRVEELDGSVKLQTTNGSITAREVSGDAELRSTNGYLRASGIGGSVIMSSTNGYVQADQIGGSLESRTTNAKVTVMEIGGRLNASTTNGSITVNSSKVGGDWELRTNQGTITLELPRQASYTLAGTAKGRIISDLPFSVSERSIQGLIGTGLYQIRVDAGGRLTIREP